MKSALRRTVATFTDLFQFRRSRIQQIFVGLLSLCCLTAAAQQEPRQLTVAVAQMQSVDGDIHQNLENAGELAQQAAEKGAKLIVFPEFMPTGYQLNFSIWDGAETENGPTVQWLKNIAKKLDAYVGTSFLEAEGEHFYNTFVLANPDGNISGRVRKQKPAGAEGFFFRGETGSHIIDTELGRIAVGICQENYRCYMSELIHKGNADLLVMPFSFPDLSDSGGIPSPPGTHVALWYAEYFGIPALMINKVGDWSTETANGTVSGFFPGKSAIVDSNSEVKVLLDGKETIGVASVILDPTLKKSDPPNCATEFNRELAIEPQKDNDNRNRELMNMEAMAIAGYQANPQRAIRARQVQSSDGQ